MSNLGNPTDNFSQHRQYNETKKNVFLLNRIFLEKVIVLQIFF